LRRQVATNIYVIALKEGILMRTIPRRYAFSAAIALAFGLTAFAQESSAPPTPVNDPDGGSVTSDQTFLKEAAEGGLAEVELGQLAVEKSSSEDVKSFAQRMVEDHGKANEDLKQLATQKGVSLPSEPTAKQKAKKEHLSKLSGDEFDRAYMSDMLKDHRTDIAAFEKESDSGKDSDIKKFASQALPTLRAHLKQAESVTGKIEQASNQPESQPQ
jgi:Predicted outer membrane protein